MIQCLSDFRIPVYAACRTPIGKFGGAFAHTSAVDLGVAVTQEALARSGVDADLVDYTVLGLARPAGVGPNPARQVAIRSGISQVSPAYTVNQACSSGMQAIASGLRHLLLKESQCVVVGGMENMTQVPYLVPTARWGHKLGHAGFVDAMYQDGFHCPLADQVMGETVEALAEEFGVTREQQDSFAVSSQEKSQQARAANLFKDEIVPVTTAKGAVVEWDEHPRDNVRLESLAKLPTVFKKQGTITAANASGITDGAAVLVLASESWAEQQGLGEPVAYLTGHLTLGLEPARMGLGPSHVLETYLGQTGLNLDDIDLFEVNEAFAAQVLACQVRGPELPLEKVNIHGGAISLGHPIGATGARIVVTLIHALRSHGKKRGLATLCVSGGMGSLIEVEIP